MTEDGKKKRNLALVPAKLVTDARQHWYAIAFLSDLPAATPGLIGQSAQRPMSTSILGDPIVLWKDLNGKACCVADKCPHRSAPLSLGNVDGDTGNIECPYHGWHMDGCSGQVTRIPALREGDKMPPNAKVHAYPTFTQDGVVYVWPGPPEQAEQAPKPPRDTGVGGVVLPEQSSGFWMQPFWTDFPVEHCLLIENLLDPAHLPFVHENTIGQRANAAALEMFVEETENGFKGSSPGKDIYNGFVAPCNLELYTPMKKGVMDMYQFSSCTPTAPGHVRFLLRMYRNFGSPSPPGSRLSLEDPLCEDYGILLGQQLRLNQNANPWNASIQVDCLPQLYRKYWKKTFGDTSKTGPWFHGWDGTLDVEELARLGTWDRDFDCNGTAIPKRPWHPKNVLEVSGAPGFAVRPQVLPPDFSAVERRDAMGLARKGKKKGEGKGKSTDEVFAKSEGKGVPAQLAPFMKADGTVDYAAKYGLAPAAAPSGGSPPAPVPAPEKNYSSPQQSAPAAAGTSPFGVLLAIAVGVAFAVGRASR